MSIPITQTVYKVQVQQTNSIHFIQFIVNRTVPKFIIVNRASLKPYYIILSIVATEIQFIKWLVLRRLTIGPLKQLDFWHIGTMIQSLVMSF